MSRGKFLFNNFLNLILSILHSNWNLLGPVQHAHKNQIYKKKCHRLVQFIFLFVWYLIWESLKILLSCFREFTLSRAQASEWHKAISEGREVHENLSHASRPPTSVNDVSFKKVKQTMLEKAGDFYKCYSSNQLFWIMFWVWSISMLESY